VSRLEAVREHQAAVKEGVLEAVVVVGDEIGGGGPEADEGAVCADRRDSREAVDCVVFLIRSTVWFS
jgi:hypothetical protein